MEPQTLEKVQSSVFGPFAFNKPEGEQSRNVNSDWWREYYNWWKKKYKSECKKRKWDINEIRNIERDIARDANSFSRDEIEAAINYPKAALIGSLLDHLKGNNITDRMMVLALSHPEVSREEIGDVLPYMGDELLITADQVWSKALKAGFVMNDQKKQYIIENAMWFIGNRVSYPPASVVPTAI